MNKNYFSSIRRKRNDDLADLEDNSQEWEKIKV